MNQERKNQDERMTRNLDQEQSLEQKVQMALAAMDMVIIINAGMNSNLKPVVSLSSTKRSMNLIIIQR